MKKAICLVLILGLFTCALAGCGKQPENTEAKAQETPAQETEEAVSEGPGLAFTTQDLDGNEVSEEIFKEKALTVVNIWGTFCGPCIGEMPELGEWAVSMDDRVQLIGLVADIDGAQDTEHIELARTIMEKAGADFVNLIPNQDFYGLLSEVIGVPTTFFVDSTGTIVGDPIIGANVKGYRDFVESYLSQLEE